MLVSEEAAHSWIESRLRDASVPQTAWTSVKTPKVIGYSRQKREVKKGEGKTDGPLWDCPSQWVQLNAQAVWGTRRGGGKAAPAVWGEAAQAWAEAA